MGLISWMDLKNNQKKKKVLYIIIQLSLATKSIIIFILPRSLESVVECRVCVQFKLEEYKKKKKRVSICTFYKLYDRLVYLLIHNDFTLA